MAHHGTRATRLRKGLHVRVLLRGCSSQGWFQVRPRAASPLGPLAATAPMTMEMCKAVSPLPPSWAPADTPVVFPGASSPLLNGAVVGWGRGPGCFAGPEQDEALHSSVRFRTVRVSRVTHCVAFRSGVCHSASARCCPPAVMSGRHFWLWLKFSFCCCCYWGDN